MATAARNSVATAKAEATESEIVFTYEDRKYTVAKAAEWDVAVLEEYEAGRVAAFLRTLLGPAQWKAFTAKPRKVKDLTAMFAAIESATVGPGN
jgi:hypothetical protein